MPPTYRVTLTAQVAVHLDEIFSYIEKDSPQNAARMIGRLLDAMEGLDMLPHRYKVVSNSDAVGDEVRSMPVGNYLVRYHVDDRIRVVTILSVRHGARV
jgi:toxin ParE1/3/4